jgi:hypothetical protein
LSFNPLYEGDRAWGQQRSQWRQANGLRLLTSTDYGVEMSSGSRRGRRSAALATIARIERNLRTASGEADVQALRRGLMEFLRQSGDIDDVLARRAKSLWFVASPMR